MEPSYANASALEALRVNTILGRARTRLSQTDLAERAGISRPTVSRIERAACRDVGLDTIERIAGALGVDVASLFVLDLETRVDDNELARRAAAPASEFLDADAVLTALDEAADPLQRYSRAGRPAVSR
jgi:transcriptional regulator with XRE-family HTH domain